jgi:regulator of sigma E protease
VILVVEALRGRPLSAKARGIVQFIGLAFLVGLMIFATFKDITRLNFFS